MNKRLQITVSGCVQGVGFRPTVYRHATALGLSGSVRNGPAGVLIEAEGTGERLAEFLERLRAEPPPQARITGLETVEVAPRGDTGFVIGASQRSGDLAVGMPPDLAVCDPCAREVLDPTDRRHGYAFSNCTNCGPRFTIFEALPYDRERTSMREFTMCTECRREYANPADRRFDAQPIACPVCGPVLRLTDAGGRLVPGEPVAVATRLLAGGAVLAIKGLGGFHLCCLATAAASVLALRQRKARPHKPLAVMFRDLAQVRAFCHCSEAEAEALVSAVCPIVVLARRPETALAASISPDTDDVGAFLPYTPLHVLLLAAVSPLVMTSANLAEEPIAADRAELGRILGPIAEFALDHNRRIVRRCDDSVIKLVRDKPLPIRRSRGYVPEPVALAGSGPSVLACGAELKNTFCVTRGRQAFLSQHIGDLVEYPAYRFYCEAVPDLVRLLGVHPEVVACDLHPDYLSTRYARQTRMPRLIQVQHHHAHVAACMAEHGLTGTVIGVAMDGTGFGPDGTVWGGEFLVSDLTGYQRLARLAHYPLPGGEEAIRHPARMALGCLLTEFGPEAECLAARLLPGLGTAERSLLTAMIRQRLRSPLTSSMGRLFDAVAALLGLCDTATYEGQAAIRLQALAARAEAARTYPFSLRTERGEPAVLGFGPTLRAIVADLDRGVDKATVAAIFHRSVAAGIAETCGWIRSCRGLTQVVLSGGVFQNDLLLTRTWDALAAHGFLVFSHQRVPPNDAGLALGQAVVALTTCAQG